MRKFHIHVIPERPATRFDRGVVYDVSAADVREAISKGRAAHRGLPEYTRADGPLRFTAVEDLG